ncbi:MAG TPA: hypothetical protein VJR23_08635 [Candidatus Acidoferrales bacterium]|nr:hypothetical protein [Candidatus Acidoferrales bacterium]
MKKFIPAILLTFLISALYVGSALAGPPPVKLYMSPASNVPSAEVLKNLSDRCPNVSITLNSKESDFMLEAKGWPGHYRFTLYKKGGDAVFATQTQYLHNAVKDVCHYINKGSK